MSKKCSQASHDFYKCNDGPDTTVYFEGPSLCRQEFADECDINVLMARYERTGVMPGPAGVQPTYVDFTEIPSDLMSTLRLMDDAQAAFMRLPANVRREFENNAHLFVDYAADPANLDQMRTWGLAPPAVVADAVKEPVAPVAAPVVPGAPAPS